MTIASGSTVMDDFELLSSSEVIRLLDNRLSYRQLDYWVRTGRISPSIRDALGTGDRRVWSPSDVRALAEILEILDRHKRELAELSSGTLWAQLHGTRNGVRKK